MLNELLILFCKNNKIIFIILINYFSTIIQMLKFFENDINILCIII